MEEKTLKEILQEETPVTEEASGEMNAGQAPDPEAAEETDAEAGQPEADQNNTDDTQDQPDDESDEEETEDGTGDEGSGEKKGFFGRRKKGDKEKAALQEKIAGLEDRVKRQMAEFDNFRKRTEKEKSQQFDMGARSVIERILPVIDNFERGLAQADENSEDPFVQGMEKIYKQMITELESIGVKPIEAEGKEFDPNLHNAVMHCEDDTVGDNIVVQELQKGYTYHDTVVRHSMVKVAN